MKSTDVLVIGGGAIGCSIAYQLAKRGQQVTLIEKDSIASHASGVAGGMLGAQVEYEEYSPIVDFSLASRGMFPQLKEELYSLTGMDIQLKPAGMLRIALTEEEKQILLKQEDWQRKMGLQAQWLSTEEVRQVEPLLTDEILGALSLPDDTQVYSPALTQALASAAVKLGATIYEQCEAIDIQRIGDQITGVVTNTGILTAQNYVLATGAWSRKWERVLDTHLPITPVKGEGFFTLTLPQPVEKTIYSHGCYLIPKGGNKLFVGATTKEEGFDERPKIDGLLELFSKATRILPALNSVPFEQALASFRPITDDLYPYLGKVTHIPNMILSCGHGRNGILQSPITGQLIAQLICGETLDLSLEPFAEGRNASSPAI